MHSCWYLYYITGRQAARQPPATACTTYLEQLGLVVARVPHGVHKHVLHAGGGGREVAQGLQHLDHRGVGERVQRPGRGSQHLLHTERNTHTEKHQVNKRMIKWKSCCLHMPVCDVVVNKAHAAAL
jgi:hypothetical protein